MSQHDELDLDTSVKHRKKLLGAVDFSLWTARLTRFMEKQAGIGGGIVICDLRISTSGGSSGTLLFAVEHDADGGRKRKELVLRYATEGGLFHTYNLPGQYAVLQGLQGTGVPVPGLAGVDATGDALGVVGYLMERVVGDTPTPSYHKAGLLADAKPENRRQMIFEAIAAQAKLHALEWKSLEVDFLMSRGNGQTAIERDLDWYWTALSWGCPDELAQRESVRNWLLANQPVEDYLCLCHGDSILPNYMFKDNKLAAVLDWELAFLGNPANDVAYQTFAHGFLGLGCEPLEGFPSLDEWKAEYERASGRKLKDWDYFYTVAAFKVHISLLLVFRSVPPEMEAIKRGALDATWQSVLDSQKKYQQQGSR